MAKIWILQFRYPSVSTMIIYRIFVIINFINLVFPASLENVTKPFFLF